MPVTARTDLSNSKSAVSETTPRTVPLSTDAPRHDCLIADDPNANASPAPIVAACRFSNMPTATAVGIERTERRARRHVSWPGATGGTGYMNVRRLKVAHVARRTVAVSTSRERAARQATSAIPLVFPGCGWDAAHL